MDTYKINPVVIRMKESEKGSIYRAIVAMGMRARQVNDNIKMEIQTRMQDVVIDTGETESINLDQIQISREFDVLLKPTFIAMQEIVENKLHFNETEEEPKEEEHL
jgi:DNA-directed RNA polymerase subunit K/omega